MAVEATALKAATELVEGFIDEALRRYPIDPRRVALMGFSQGGVMAYALAIARPERFAAIAALSSWFPDALAQGAGLSGARIDLPALVAHGTADHLVAIEYARESIRRLRALGLSPDYREYACGHEISQPGLYDLSDFLAANLLNAASG
jgi:phospholipase/carboxylesterase